MTVNRGPGVAPIAGVGTTTVEHRLQLAGLYAENAPGVPRSGVLGQANDQLVVGKLDMSYDVGPAALVISRTASEGVYTPTLTGTTNVVTDAAPATNSRWDLIYVKQNDQAKGDADNAAVIGVQKGTAAASPTKPTGDLPSGAYVLAEARIFAGTTGTSGGSNTVAQVWRHTAARGAPIIVRNITERAEITSPAASQQVIRRDVGRVETFDGTTWRGSGVLSYTNTSFLQVTDYAATVEIGVASVAWADPGVPYRIRVSGSVEVTTSDPATSMEVRARLDTDTGAVLGSVWSRPSGVPAGVYAAMAIGSGGLSAELTGARNVRALLYRPGAVGAWSSREFNNALTVDLILG